MSPLGGKLTLANEINCSQCVEKKNDAARRDGREQSYVSDDVVSKETGELVSLQSSFRNAGPHVSKHRSGVELPSEMPNNPCSKT